MKEVGFLELWNCAFKMPAFNIPKITWCDDECYELHDKIEGDYFESD